MDANDLVYLSIRQAANLIAAKEVSPVELTDACIVRAEALDDAMTHERTGASGCAIAAPIFMVSITRASAGADADPDDPGASVAGTGPEAGSGALPEPRAHVRLGAPSPEGRGSRGDPAPSRIRRTAMTAGATTAKPVRSRNSSPACPGGSVNAGHAPMMTARGGHHIWQEAA